MSVVISASKDEETSLKAMIESSFFPSRVQVIPHIISGDGFPINTLRNIAIHNVHTTHFLMVDIDILPARRLSPFSFLYNVQ